MSDCPLCVWRGINYSCHGSGHIDLIDKSTTNVDLKSLLEFEIHARDIFREWGRIQDATDMEASIENVRHSLLTLGIS